MSRDEKWHQRRQRMSYEMTLILEAIERLQRERMWYEVWPGWSNLREDRWRRMNPSRTELSASFIKRLKKEGVV